VELNSAYSQARANRMQAEQRWRQAMATPALNLPDVLANPAVQSLTRERAELQATLQQELQRRQEQHPAVIQARAQIAELDRQIGTIAAGVRASIGNQYRVAAGQEAALSGNVNALKAATFAEQDKSVRYNILKREADTNRSLYNTLLQRYQDVSTQAANLINPISIIDRAQPSSSPAYPRPMLNMALAGMAGIALALVAGFARNRRDNEVHGPADVEREFPMPLLGVVPLLKDGGSVVEALENPQSPLTEAHHTISLALDPVTRSSENSLLLLTSSCPDEGKTTIAIKLAANLAAAGKKVLMIDGDMRRGSVHSSLGLPNSPGLADLLSKDSGHRLADATRYCEDVGFTVLPRGCPSTNPAQLLASSRFATLIAETAGLYDAVIVDGPPVLGLADAPRLARAADATVFIVEANRTSKEHAKIALRRLSDAGAEQIGLVLNKYDPDKDIGASDYAYRYDYAVEEADVQYEQLPRSHKQQADVLQPAE
jgi:capsular exopolysaccharide synthesis family protein